MDELVGKEIDAFRPIDFFDFQIGEGGGIRRMPEISNLGRNFSSIVLHDICNAFGEPGCFEIVQMISIVRLAANDPAVGGR